MHVLVINGPNLNLLGTRQPEVYGSTTLADVEQELKALAGDLGIQLTFVQSNHEGAIVDAVQATRRDGVDHVIINPGAYTHTSVAIRDAFAAVGTPFVEVHVSNVFAREEFRHHSYLSPLASAVLVGCGTLGYSLALRLVHSRLIDAAGRG